MKAETKKSERRGRVGQLRCPNCFERFRPAPGVDKEACPHCGVEWYISWKGKLAKVRKPVWESWERSLDEMRKTE
ncbi:MAG: hypothetical protein PVF45_05085 [Anaerolineae bacterium]